METTIIEYFGGTKEYDPNNGKICPISVKQMFVINYQEKIFVSLYYNGNLEIKFQNDGEKTSYSNIKSIWIKTFTDVFVELYLINSKFEKYTIVQIFMQSADNSPLIDEIRTVDGMPVDFVD